MLRAAPSSSMRRVRIGITGTVQGVGFRPFVYRLASGLELSGAVCNDAAGVTIEVEGIDASIECFLDRLSIDAPPAARITRVTVDELRPAGSAGFVVAPSRRTGQASISVPPDLATCETCVSELFDPADRRYRYPFINCTACGPRFTIARRLPYDRSATTMRDFVMCEQCRTEYEDPRDRRFHAQPNACPACGPRAWLADANGTESAPGSDVDAVAAAACAILAGRIVAIKGLGGYHLACRADDPSIVARLRARKRRDDKPFAVMARDQAMAETLADLGACELRALSSVVRPILLARRAPDAPVAPQVAPGQREIGILLPYAPLHHLLMRDVGLPIVLTSGNASDEPIAYRDDDAFTRLSGIADLFLTHDRPIETRCEDSIARVVRVGGEPRTMVLRRARGLVPERIAVPVAASGAILATGGHLKNTACLLRGSDAIIGPHAGDLSHAEAFAAFVRSTTHLARLADAAPSVIAHDLHPEYLSTKFALDRTDLEPEGVQHHHAHLAACLAEHGEPGPAVGMIFDGAGLGTDGAVWGGEILFGDLGRCVRLGHLRAVRMPGGEAAMREPWRMACAWLTDAHGVEPSRCSSLTDITPERWSAVSRLSRSSFAPLTTSVGRLIDACAAIAGVRARTTFEGQAAMEFEACARARDAEEAYPMKVDTSTDTIVIDPREMILAVERDANAGRDRAEISCAVHNGLVYAARLAALIAAQRVRSRTIVLSGGVFQNVLMLEALAGALERDGCRVLVPCRVPPNDGGLSFGQAAVAAWRRRTNVPGDSRAGD